MTDEPIPSLAEAMTELRRLRARVTILEAELAFLTGRLAEQQADPPFHVEHDIPPSTPRE